MNQQEIQYVSDEKGQTVAVIVPIDLWRDIESEKETAYLLKSPANVAHLERSIAQYKQGQIVEKDLLDEESEVGLDG